MGGEPESVRKLADGSLCIQVNSERHSSRLLRCKQFCGVSCAALPHSTLNHSKGVITCWDLRDESEEDILDHLQKQRGDVVKVERIRQKKNGELHKTNAFIIAFNSVSIRSEIKVAYHRVKSVSTFQIPCDASSVSDSDMSRNTVRENLCVLSVPMKATPTKIVKQHSITVQTVVETIQPFLSHVQSGLKKRKS